MRTNLRPMITVNAHEAKASLSSLPARSGPEGGRALLFRDGKPVRRDVLKSRPVPSETVTQHGPAESLTSEEWSQED